MSYIYFFQIDDGPHIKIGYSRRHARQRKTELERGGAATLHRHRLRLLAWVHGVPADEKAVQRHFAHCLADASSPEIFTATWDLTDYIRWLQNQYFVKRELDEIPPNTATYDLWAPGNGRSKSPPSDPLFPPDMLEFPISIMTADDYYTPPAIVSAMQKLYGGYPDLDPASHSHANQFIQARQFFAKSENGLDKQWFGNVWVNPPFSMWKAWAPKIVSESSRVNQMCVLSAMRTVTSKQFRQLLEATSAIVIITGRHKFNGRGTESPDDGHCVMYIGQSRLEFIDAFNHLGVVFETVPK